jgi:hypothetical protein
MPHYKDPHTNPGLPLSTTGSMVPSTVPDWPLMMLGSALAPA